MHCDTLVWILTSKFHSIIVFFNLRVIIFFLHRNCKQFEDLPNNLRVEIGSQLDISFITNICKTYGPFDFIIDDGGHKTDQIITSLKVLWPSCLRDHGVYAIEDIHTMSMWAGKKGMLVDKMDVREQTVVTHILHTYISLLFYWLTD